MVIERSKHPRCFGSLGSTERGFDQYSNSKAGMNPELFSAVTLGRLETEKHGFYSTLLIVMAL